MKKFLLIAIFFLTLLPVIGDGGYSRLSAQRMAFEDGSWWLPDVEVNGEKKETCDICGETYDANDPSSHECTVKCEYCGETVDLDRYDHHMETVHPNLADGSYCPFCNTQLTKEEEYTHDCRNLTITGGSGGGSGGSGGGSLNIGIGTGGNSGGNNGGGTGWNDNGNTGGNNNGNNTPPSSNNWKGLDNAIKHLNSKAISYKEYKRIKKSGECAKYVRLALQAGGIDTSDHPVYAKDYGSYLIKWGFHEVSRTNYVPQKGDIRVWQNYPGGSVAGHIHLFNGQSWVSDFFEPNNDGPNPKYRKYNNYKIYRR